MEQSHQAMTHRDRALAVLRYQDYDHLPVVHFGYWPETLVKWAEEGHLTEAEAKGWTDGNVEDASITRKLGFDFNWYSTFSPNAMLDPHFQEEVVKTLPDGSKHIRDYNGVIVLQTPEAGSIPAEIEHTLVDRESWEEHYKWRHQWNEDRVLKAAVRVHDKMVPFGEGGREFLQSFDRDYHYGLFCGSMFGHIRNVIGVEGAAYIYADDDELLEEMVQTVSDLIYQNTKYVLEAGCKFDFAHFWEDICFKNGPLVIPSMFDEMVGPHYKRITDLVKQYGIDIISLDSDGLIDSLIPTWFKNGVNTMFPIEVGTWKANISPWREKFGKDLRGVGGMNKTVFAKDRAAIDAEIERLKPLVELGGYIPCPDHRIPPDALWDNVRYYTDRMHEVFGG